MDHLKLSDDTRGIISSDEIQEFAYLLASNETLHVGFTADHLDEAYLFTNKRLIVDKGHFSHYTDMMDSIQIVESLTTFERISILYDKVSAFSLAIEINVPIDLQSSDENRSESVDYLDSVLRIWTSDSSVPFLERRFERFDDGESFVNVYEMNRVLTHFLLR